MKVNGETRIYGIFGYPIRHTLSPAIQNAAFQALKIPAVYIPFEVPPEALGPALRGLVALGIEGVNLTIPHKEHALDFIDRLTPEAHTIGAVNTVVVHKGELIGHNTDGEGFLLSLRRDLRFNPRGKSIAVLGAGGAARSIAISLLSLPLKRLVLFNRSSDRLGHLVYHLKRTFSSKKRRIAGEVIGSRKIKSLDGFDLVVQATSVGMDGRGCLVLPDALRRGISIYDTIYSPHQTPLVRIARRKGLSTADGLGMLIYQGALAFEWWTGRRAPIEEMRKALKKVPGSF